MACCGDLVIPPRAGAACLRAVLRQVLAGSNGPPRGTLGPADVGRRDGAGVVSCDCPRAELVQSVHGVAAGAHPLRLVCEVGEAGTPDGPDGALGGWTWSFFSHARHGANGLAQTH